MRNLFFLVIPTIMLAATVQAQTFELRQPTRPPDAAAEIVGGRKAAPANWPATYVFDGVMDKACTATAVGPHVILTAAHCLPQAASGTIRDTRISVWCEKAPLHNYGYDIALCASSAPIPIARDKPYETVDLGGRPDPGLDLAMLGYGCTRVGGARGVLYEGEAKVGAWEDGERQFASVGAPALCSGDSGGAAYSPPGEDRKVVGVASEIEGNVSRFTFLAHPYIIDFISQWQRRQVNPATQQTVEVRICGIDGTNAYCRR